MRVLVTGATGFVGGRLVPALIDRGHEVRVLVRDPARYDARPGVEVASGDLLEPGSFEAAMDGIEAAYYLVHSMHAGGDFAERDRQCATNFAAAADDAGIERVVYLGGLGEDRDDLSKHLKSRREVETILGNASYDLTTLRAAIIIGAGSASFEMIRQATVRLPVMVTPKWVRTNCQPIAIRDVIAYLTAVLDAPGTAGDTFEIGGPDVLTYESLLCRTARIAIGREPFVVPVPVLTPKLSSYWMGLVTDVPTSVAHPLILGLKNPVVVTDDRIDDLVDVDRTPLETAIRRALAVGGHLDADAAPTSPDVDVDPNSGDGGESRPGTGPNAGVDA